MSKATGQLERRRYFATRIVFASERPSIMRKHIYTGAMGNIWAHLISGIFFVYFGNAVGMTPLQWGLMSGISSWLFAAQLLSAHVTERTGRRKLLWFWFAILDRIIRLLGIATAYLVWSAGYAGAAAVLILAICLANLFGTMGNPPWLSWLADIVPEEEHGRFWGRRATWVALSSIAVIIPAGFFVDRLPDEYRMIAVMAVLGAASAIGIADILIHGTIPEPLIDKREETIHERSILRGLLEPLRDQRFRPWLIFNGFWTFGMTLGGALGTIHFVTNLGFNETFLGGTIVITSFNLLGTVLTGRRSGTLVDRVGIKPVLRWGHPCWAMLPIFWLLANPDNALVMIACASILGGVSSTAATTAANKLITRYPPDGRRATYIALSSSIGSVAGGFGVMTAGIVVQAVQSAGIAGLEWTFGGFRLTFLASLILRNLAAHLLLPRLPK